MRFLRSARGVRIFTVLSPLPVWLPLDAARRASPFCRTAGRDRPAAPQRNHLSRLGENVQLADSRPVVVHRPRRTIDERDRLRLAQMTAAAREAAGGY